MEALPGGDRLPTPLHLIRSEGVAPDQVEPLPRLGAVDYQYAVDPHTSPLDVAYHWTPEHQDGKHPCEDVARAGV